MRGMVRDRSQSSRVLLGMLARLAASSRATSLLTLATAVLVTLSTYIVQAYRLSMAPDIFVDEVTYFFVGNSIAQGDGMRQYWFAPERVFFWHPPFFFLLEAAVLRAVSPLPTDTIAAVFLIRHLNVALSALTAGLLFLLGRRLRDVPTGFLMVLLFAFDPFILRSARRNLLEIPLMALLVGGILLLSYYPRGLNRRGALVLGVIFGLAMLTKEIAFYILLLPALLVFLGQPAVLTLLERPGTLLHTLRHPGRLRPAWRSFIFLDRSGKLWRSLPWVVLCGGISLLIYALYPLWAWYNGYWQDFWYFRTYQFSRFEGSVQASGWNTGGKRPSFLEALSTNIPLYGTSYALIMLGTLFGAFLLLRSWQDVGARLLGAWFLLSGAFFAFVILRGQLNDQFFYMLIIPNAACIGYGTPLVLRAAVRTVRRFTRQRVAALLLTLTLSTGIFANGVLYYNAYVVGVDNGYEQFHRYLLANIPPGTPLLIGGDAGIHLFPEYPTYLARTKQEVYAHRIHYFVLSSKEAWGNFNGVSQEFYDWVRANAVEQFAIDEPTFWHFALYYMAYPEENQRQSGPGNAVGIPPTGSTAPAAPAVLSPLQLAARPIPPFADTATRRYFTSTGHSVSGAFKRFWETRGGLLIFGYPLTEAYTENGRLVQYFERVRLEQDPTRIGTDQEIQVTDLGSELTKTRHDQAAFLPVAPSAMPLRSYFPDTGHTLGEPFRAYWEQHGAQDIFGKPISEEMTEVNPVDGQLYRVQYFERARFEYHPESKDPAMSILLGHLGRQALLNRGWQP